MVARRRGGLYEELGDLGEGSDQFGPWQRVTLATSSDPEPDPDLDEVPDQFGPW